MSKAQTLKSIVKKGGAEKPSFGTNPWDPWSAKANIAEDAALDQYLTSRGINPKHVSKDQKVAHSKMGQFLKWKRDHSVAEEIELDEVSTDGYHKAAIKSRQDAAVKVMSSMGKDKAAKTKLDARNRGLKRLGDRTSAEMKKANSGPQKPVHHPASSMSSPQAYYASKKPGEYTGDSVQYSADTNVISEISSETLQSYKNKAMKSSDDLASKGEYKKSNNRLLNHMKATGKQIDKTTASIKKSLNKENTQDPMAASSMPNDGANSPDDVEQPKNKKLIQMSKSARIIKSIYKRKGMKEEIYDHEKEDKSVATYGKKPKMQSVSTDLEEPQAAAVLTGGTTLTGEKRDTIEIDPMMKMRKPVSGKR
jgi:hypothetical protein